MSDEKKMRDAFLRQEGALPSEDHEASGQVWPRAFGVSTPELHGEMETVEPSADAAEHDDVSPDDARD